MYNSSIYIFIYICDPGEAEAATARLLYRIWGMTMVRAQAWLKPCGLSSVGTSTSAAARRRTAAAAWHARAREAYSRPREGGSPRRRFALKGGSIRHAWSCGEAIVGGGRKYIKIKQYKNA